MLDPTEALVEVASSIGGGMKLLLAVDAAAFAVVSPLLGFGEVVVGTGCRGMSSELEDDLVVGAFCVVGEVDVSSFSLDVSSGVSTGGLDGVGVGVGVVVGVVLELLIVSSSSLVVLSSSLVVSSGTSTGRLVEVGVGVVVGLLDDSASSLVVSSGVSTGRFVDVGVGVVVGLDDVGLLDVVGVGVVVGAVVDGVVAGVPVTTSMTWLLS